MRVHVPGRAPRPSAAFGVFWRFMSERQRIYRGRIGGRPESKTADPILEQYRFTNVFRASDRVSQALITNVIYDGETRAWTDTFARILVFKLFNRVETWDAIVMAVGEVTAELVADRSVDRAVGDAARRGAVYSGAYIMPPPNGFDGPKFKRHLSVLRMMLADDVPTRLADADSMRDAYRLLLSYPSIGPFLAYQYVTDLNYASQLGFSEMDFVQAGPGAIRGIRKMFEDPGGYSDADIIRWVCERQYDEMAARGEDWRGLRGRPAQLIDIQNVFCEVDKYTRVSNPELDGGSTSRKQIKQQYRPASRPLTSWFPPCWKINDGVRRTTDAITPTQLELV